MLGAPTLGLPYKRGYEPHHGDNQPSGIIIRRLLGMGQDRGGIGLPDQRELHGAISLVVYGIWIQPGSQATDGPKDISRWLLDDARIGLVTSTPAPSH